MSPGVSVTIRHLSYFASGAERVGNAGSSAPAPWQRTPEALKGHPDWTGPQDEGRVGLSGVMSGLIMSRSHESSRL